ncbi:thioredoxin family protein [Paraclostridium bifermentans]|uniref:thioredoxin family protein n=1 Tax=Paraclostridium bifermentans TaxID=1490 RepID=UPI001C7FC7EB|nr:thioredoxin family protein [Paraclostridium bifermentans]MDM8129337.1 thioredoxin family protein [Paraclostridium benzoelyticum]MDO7204395.1 thioredoxin family protein [Paraclostridium bifermentans]GIM33506.1 thioredoxin family protein [Paraclostridium bifermentans subsp. muricolitidis]
MEIKILGSGCSSCNDLLKRTEKAVEELGLEASFEKVTDIVQIMSFGVMKTPALVVNGKVKTSGRVPSVEDIKDLLK